MIIFLIVFSFLFFGGGYLMFFTSVAAITFGKIIFLFFASMLGATVFGLFPIFIVNEIINVSSKKNNVIAWKKEIKTIIPYQEHSEEKENFNHKGKYMVNGKILFTTDKEKIYLWIKENDEIKKKEIDSREFIEIYKVEKGSITHNQLVIKKPVLHLGLWTLSFSGNPRYIIYIT